MFSTKVIDDSMNSNNSQYDFVWDCREIPLGHSPQDYRLHGKSSALPNLPAQESGHVAVTVCRTCKNHLPGRLMNVRPDDIESYFEIEDSQTLFVELPDGLSATGGSRKRRRMLLEYAMEDPYNPGEGHAGKTLKYSLGYALPNEEWQPR